MLKLSDVRTYYGNIQALKGVSLEISQGEIVTLIGANGAGKTTTLMSICGIVPPRKGEIFFEGRSLGLAPIVVKRIFEIINKINTENQTTIFLVEQNANLALKVAHRGYVMENGRITLNDTAANLMANEGVKKAYLGL